MSLIVENGTGLSDAESFISVVDASTYITNYAGSADISAWAALDEAGKESILRKGAQYLCLEYGNRFKGMKSVSTQALCSPRTGSKDEDGYIIDSNIVPECFKRANVEAALRFANGDDLLGVQDEPGTIKREKSKLGPIETETEYVAGKSQVKYYPKIEAILKPVLWPCNEIQRG